MSVSFLRANVLFQVSGAAVFTMLWMFSIGLLNTHIEHDYTTCSIVTSRQSFSRLIRIAFLNIFLGPDWILFKIISLYWRLRRMRLVLARWRVCLFWKNTALRLFQTITLFLIFVIPRVPPTNRIACRVWHISTRPPLTAEQKYFVHQFVRLFVRDIHVQIS